MRHIVSWLLAPVIVSATPGQRPVQPVTFSDSGTCPQPHISCPSSTPSDVDTCCLNHPSGHFLLTQFWDSSPSLGPVNSWTIHGLWPDFCHGGFDQYCDSSRSYSDIYSILSSVSSPYLLDFMSKYWLSLNGNPNHLWSHEWNKHGTCISTLEPDCYPSSSDDEDDLHRDVVDYFTHATTLFSTLNTYDALAASAIIPTYERAYDLEDLQTAIATLQGAEVTFRCHGQELQEIWYHFITHGPLRDAATFTNETITSSAAVAAAKHKFRAVDPDGSKTNCPATGIRYLPKQPRQPLPTHTSASSTSTSTASPTSSSTPFSGKGHLLVRPISNSSSSASSSSKVHGCLIRSGSWYLTRGSSCANYIAKSDPKHISFLDHDRPVSVTTAGRERLALANAASSKADTAPHAGEPPSTDEYFPEEISIKPVRGEKDDEDEHLFTLSSLYAPCAIMPSFLPEGGGLFTCGKNLGIQSIFSSVCDDGNDSDSASSGKECKSGRYKLDHVGNTTFYADHIPGKLEKVGIYVDNEDGERKIQLEVLWEAL